MSDVEDDRLWRPLTEIAAEEPQIEGIPLGIPAIDRLTNGIRPGRLNLVAGYSGNGKTALMLSTAVRVMSEATPVLYVTADDSDDAILHKVLAMRLGMSLEQVEREGAAWRVAQAREIEGSLAICAPRTGTYGIGDLGIMWEEWTERWGRPPALCAFDYLSLLSVGSFGDDGMSGVKAKAGRLKALARQTSQSVWLIGHQCKKEAGSDCNALTLNHLEYGGHQEADGVVLGCRRRLTTTKMEDWEVKLEESSPTTNVSVMKNKVTGRTSPDPRGTPVVIDPTSGLLRELTVDEQRDRDRKGRRGTPTTVLRYPGQYQHEHD